MFQAANFGSAAGSVAKVGLTSGPYGLTRGISTVNIMDHGLIGDFDAALSGPELEVCPTEGSRGSSLWM